MRIKRPFFITFAPSYLPRSRKRIKSRFGGFCNKAARRERILCRRFFFPICKEFEKIDIFAPATKKEIRIPWIYLPGYFSRFFYSYREKK